LADSCSYGDISILFYRHNKKQEAGGGNMTPLYKLLLNSLPKGYTQWVKQYLDYANFTISVEKYAGFSVMYGAVLFLSIFSLLFILDITTMLFSAIIGLVVLAVFEVFMHGILILTSDSRANFTEEILPDALRLISSNIRSGLTPDKALMLSARSEFGPLEEEIRKAAKKTLSGESIEDAIKIISEKINSRSLERTINLISEGMAKGGSLQQLLDGLADDIREARLMKKEISAQVMVYAIFIFFAVCIGAPLLLAISGHLVQTMGGLSKAIDVKQTISAGFFTLRLQAFEIKASFLLLYSLVSLSVTSIFGGMLIGLLQEGSEKSGLKFMPILLIISISIFLITRLLVTKLFGVGI
jgi:flagellar protein FlaJ